MYRICKGVAPRPLKTTFYKSGEDRIRIAAVLRTATTVSSSVAPEPAVL